MDFDLGKEALKTSQSYVNNKMQKVSFKHFRPYFNIDNQYLYKKILLIIFPYNTSIWESHDSSIANPDLYIPLSSLATYILLKCFFFGLQNAFQPEKIGILFTRTVFLEIFLFFITSISTYILGIKTGYIESICYSGYKYFVILCIHLCGIRWIKFIFRIYMYVSFFFFLSRCLKKTVLGESSLNRTRKIYFLFGYVGIQTLLIFLLS
ncbi:Protein transport protein yif1 [Nosema bombycis CQ1]|uniref:Protein YIF1 n=1 Tax=Nosema bombycis (strain CQ1 / CVCC 102059) TaxID=578461 RepID=R0MEH4_NOSB1|nr:Protein transport protein yif1 [Nosema bombycis CQ1]|eukprot:EOB12505.1 Protein transport protein yif1 [Nosema bombycis CQ1]